MKTSVLSLMSLVCLWGGLNTCVNGQETAPAADAPKKSVVAPKAEEAGSPSDMVKKPAAAESKTESPAAPVEPAPPAKPIVIEAAIPCHADCSSCATASCCDSEPCCEKSCCKQRHPCRMLRRCR
jgi:hypothetical protein